MTPDHDFQLAVTESLAEIKTQLRAAVGKDGNGGKLHDIDERLTALEKSGLQDVDERVTMLEQSEWKRTGFAAAVSAALGVAGTYLFGHRAH